MTEDQLEQETLGWLAGVGYTHLYGPDIAHDGDSPERENYRQVLLVERVRRAITRLNPSVPLAAREDALKQIVDLGLPIQLSANRLFHRLQVSGVPVQYQKDGERYPRRSRPNGAVNPAETNPHPADANHCHSARQRDQAG